MNSNTVKPHNVNLLGKKHVDCVCDASEWLLNELKNPRRSCGNIESERVGFGLSKPLRKHWEADLSLVSSDKPMVEHPGQHNPWMNINISQPLSKAVLNEGANSRKPRTSSVHVVEATKLNSIPRC